MKNNMLYLKKKGGHTWWVVEYFYSVLSYNSPILTPRPPWFEPRHVAYLESAVQTLCVLGHGSPRDYKWNIRALDISLPLSQVRYCWLNLSQSFPTEYELDILIRKPLNAIEVSELL